MDNHCVKRLLSFGTAILCISFFLFLVIPKITSDCANPALSTYFPNVYAAGNCDFDIVLLLDTSGSMRQIQNGISKMQWEKDAATAFVNQLENTAYRGNIRISVINFGGMGGHTPTRVQQTLTSDFGAVRSRISGLHFVAEGGGTCIQCAVRAANSELWKGPSADIPRYVLLFSDGRSNRTIANGNDDVTFPTGRQAAISEANIGKTHATYPIEYFTIGYGGNGGQYDALTLTGIANDLTNYFPRPNPEDWASAFIAIAISLCRPPPTPTSTPIHTVTPTPSQPPTNVPIIMKARTRILTPGDTESCDINHLPPGYDSDTTYTMTDLGGGGSSRTEQSHGASYAEWQNNVATTYRIDTQAASLDGRAVLRYCRYLRRDSNPNLEPDGDGNIINLSASGTVREVIWEVLTGSTTRWIQTAGGDVYASSSITSLLPSTELFARDLTTVKAGVVSKNGSLYLNAAGTDYSHISSTNWNTKSAFSPSVAPSYDTLKNRLEDNFKATISGMDGMSSLDSGIYYIDHNPVINTAISVPANRWYVFVIDDSLTINETIHVNPGGFIAFVVRDDIIVNKDLKNGPGSYKKYNTLGQADLEGAYIAGGNFQTGYSDKQLTGKGMFIADSFLMTRDLGTQNDTYPPHLFVFDPSLLFSMPVELMITDVRWQEVAPQAL